jgi:hypothetical protein
MNNNLNSKINKGICFSIETKVSHKFLIPTQKMNYQPIKSKSNLNFLANTKKNHKVFLALREIIKAKICFRKDKEKIL